MSAEAPEGTRDRYGLLIAADVLAEGVTLGGVRPGEGATARHQPDRQKGDEDAGCRSDDPAGLHGAPSEVLGMGEGSGGEETR